MKRLSIPKLVLLLLTGIIVSSFALLTPKEEKKEAEAIKWMTIEEALTATQQKPKKIFIDVYTGWCGWCKKMDQTTFSDPAVVSYMNKNFYAVKLDAEQKSDIVLGNQTFKYQKGQNGRGYNQLAISLLQGKMSFPTVVFLDEKFQMLQPIPGFRKVDEFKKFMEFFATEKYKEKPESNEKQ